MRRLPVFSFSAPLKGLSMRAASHAQRNRNGVLPNVLHPPDPPIALQSISRDAPFSQGGDGEPTMLPPSSLVFFLSSGGLWT